jgi:hypothetical protein
MKTTNRTTRTCRLSESYQRCRQAIDLRWVIALAVVVQPFSADLALAQWQFDPIVRVAWDYDDNAGLSSRTDNKDRISGYIGELTLGVFFRDQNTAFGLEPILRSRKYDSESDRDSDDQFLNLRYRFSGEKNTFTFRGGYARESVRTAELADSDLDAEVDPDEITDDETAFINTRQRREKLQAVPRWSYRISDVSSIAADVRYLSVDYVDSVQAVGLIDYTDIRANLSYNHRFSARTNGVLVATARNYNADEFDQETSGYGVSAGINRDLSETTSVQAFIGLEDTEVADGDSEVNPVYDVSLTRRQETTNLLLQYRRRISGSGQGSLSKRDEVNLRFTRQLNDVLASGLGARAYQSESIGPANIATDYVQLHAQLLWQLSRAFSLTADYRYTVLQRSLDGEGANSNRFTIWLSYQPNSQGRIQLRP